MNLTKFQTAVLLEVAKIPFGETKTYKQIAEAINKPKAARAVGNACNKNPLPFLIPCHRVVGSSGNLTGYAYGLKVKKQLLDFEKQTKSKLNGVIKL